MTLGTYKFPTYLLPSLPFRRNSSGGTSNTSSRKSSTDSHASTSSTTATTHAASSTTPSAPPPASFLSGHASHIRCNKCLADLALSSQIISKGFTGRHGRAYLVAPANSWPAATASARHDRLPNLPNTLVSRPVPRQLVTGAHTVSDISCALCKSVLGWKYVAAEEDAQRYKVGKFILETKRICRSSNWELDDAVCDDAAAAAGFGKRAAAGDEVEFDSQDEEECEDLFLGIWNPRLAAKRRKMKAFEQADSD